MKELEGQEAELELEEPSEDLEAGLELEVSSSSRGVILLYHLAKQ